jgi:hypothetical protein
MAYTLTGRKCGTVRFTETETGTVTRETLSASTKITDNPIEDGSNINDHVFNNPDQFSISGAAIGNAGEIQSKLNGMKEQGDIITYSGRIRIDSLVIQSWSPSYDSKNKNGFGFTVSFKKVKVSTSEYVEMGAVPLRSRQDNGKSESSINTAAVKSDGLKTTVSASISTSAYMDYVNQYNSKPASSSGISGNPSYNGVSK